MNKAHADTDRLAYVLATEATRLLQSTEIGTETEKMRTQLPAQTNTVREIL